MAISSKVDLEHERKIKGKCDRCDVKQPLKQDWLMESKSSRRGDRWGVRHAWLYHCVVCGNHIDVLYWQETPTMAMFVDSDFK